MKRGELVPMLLAVVPDLPDAALARAAPEEWAEAHGARELELGSLAVLQLVDLLEARLDLVLGSAEVTRANFASLDSLAGLVVGRLGAGS